ELSRVHSNSLMARWTLERSTEARQINWAAVRPSRWRRLCSANWRAKEGLKGRDYDRTPNETDSITVDELLGMAYHAYARARSSPDASTTQNRTRVADGSENYLAWCPGDQG